MSDEAFTSLRFRSRAETKVKGSRFIAEAIPVSTVERAEAEIETVRKRAYDATHHCSAYRVGTTGDVYRYDDDGEPSGTAGAPILRRIDAHELTNVIVIVTRYYGGTKLGKGGLARAYGEAADEALKSADIVTHVIFSRVNVSFGYDDTAEAMKTIERYDAKIVESIYRDRTDLLLAVPQSRVNAFTEAFVESLGGRGRIDT